MSQGDVEIVRDHFAASNEGDIARALGYYADDVELVVPDDAFLEAPNDRGEQFDRHGTALDRGFQPGDGDHSLPCLDELLMVDADCLKGREPVREEASDACVTSEAASSDHVREATDELDFDLGMRRFHEAFDVALVVSAPGSLNHVDVLLRHRLLREAHGFEGLTFRPVLADAHDFVAPQLVDVRLLGFQLDTALASLDASTHRDDHMRISVNELD